MQTTNAAGLFSIDTDGLVQGVAMDDPAVRYALAGGVLALTETLPMLGGIPISEFLPVSGSNGVMGETIARATTTAGITGIAVLNQAHNAIVSPQNTAPKLIPGDSVNFYRLGSGARIPVAIDSSLLSLNGGLITQQVSWDFTNNKIIAYNATPGALPVKILYISPSGNKVATYSTSTGFATWGDGALALIQI